MLYRKALRNIACGLALGAAAGIFLFWAMGRISGPILITGGVIAAVGFFWFLAGLIELGLAMWDSYRAGRTTS